MNTSFLWFHFPCDDILCWVFFKLSIETCYDGTPPFCFTWDPLPELCSTALSICLNTVHNVWIDIYLCYPLQKSILGVNYSAPERKWAGYVRAWGNRPVTRWKTWPSASPVFKHLGCQAWPVTPLARLMVSIPHCSIFFVSNCIVLVSALFTRDWRGQEWKEFRGPRYRTILVCSSLWGRVESRGVMDGFQCCRGNRDVSVEFGRGLVRDWEPSVTPWKLC